MCVIQARLTPCGFTCWLRLPTRALALAVEQAFLQAGWAEVQLMPEQPAVLPLPELRRVETVPGWTLDEILAREG